MLHAIRPNFLIYHLCQDNGFHSPVQAAVHHLVTNGVSRVGHGTPFEIDNFPGKRYLIRPSNTFWRDKRNVRMECTESGNDQFFYQAVKPGSNDSDVKSMQGKTTPVPDAVATFSWQGKGLLRLFGAKWEILGYNETGEEGRSWMMTFTHKTMFTSPAVNVVCRSRNGLSDADFRQVEGWLTAIKDDVFQKAVQDMFTISQD